MRYLIVGDVHGCFDELRELVERAQLDAGDAIVSVGDVVRKGPAVIACLVFLRTHGARPVLGNNEAKLLRARRNLFTRMRLDARDRAVLADHAQMRAIATWPLSLELPEIGVRVVHGGVMPDGSCPRAAALELRFLRRDGDRWIAVPKGEERDGDVFWSEVWRGPLRVVYGHTPRENVRIDAHAIGLDTGCVYGGSLSAALFHGPGEWEIVSVRARARYAA